MINLRLTIAAGIVLARRAVRGLSVPLMGVVLAGCGGGTSPTPATGATEVRYVLRSANGRPLPFVYGIAGSDTSFVTATSVRPETDGGLTLDVTITGGSTLVYRLQQRAESGGELLFLQPCTSAPGSGSCGTPSLRSAQPPSGDRWLARGFGFRFLGDGDDAFEFGRELRPVP